MTILVTGAGGFLGLNLLDAMQGSGVACVALNDRPMPPGYGAGPGRAVAVADVRDRAAMAEVLQRHAIGTVIHAAAVTLAPGSRLASVEAAFDVNTVSTAILLEEARRAGVTRFVYPSSTAVYGAALYESDRVDEDTPPRPMSVYGYSKLASERLVVEAAASFGLSCVRARITALFGPHERETGARDLMSLPYQLARAALAGRRVRLPRGHARDWTFARDVAEALLRLAVADTLPRDLYTLGLGAVWDPAILAEALAGVNPDWDHGPGAPDGSDSGLVFPDDPSAPRQPLRPDRFVRDFGPVFRGPEAAARDYADWLAQGGAATIGAG